MENRDHIRLKELQIQRRINEYRGIYQKRLKDEEIEYVRTHNMQKHDKPENEFKP
jgi:hypothetical protein